MVLDSRSDDIIRGAFGVGFMIGELVNGDQISVVGEHHNPVK